MRITTEDCDMPSPSMEDVLVDLEALSSAARRFLPEVFGPLAKYWIILLELTDIVGKILGGGYRPGTPLMDSATVDSLEAKLSTIIGSLSASEHSLQSSLSSFYQNLLKLHHAYVSNLLKQLYHTY
jgi:hypothetical protein